MIDFISKRDLSVGPISIAIGVILCWLYMRKSSNDQETIDCDILLHPYKGQEERDKNVIKYMVDELPSLRKAYKQGQDEYKTELACSRYKIRQKCGIVIETEVQTDR